MDNNFILRLKVGDILDKKSLPPKSMTVFKIWVTFIMSLISFISGVIAVFNIYTAMSIMFISLMIYCYMIFFYCKLKYNNERYSISTEKIYRERGVFFKRETSIPIDKIQCIKIVSEPISEFFRLCTIIFYTSGINEKIPLINVETANDIKERLQVKIKNEI